MEVILIALSWNILLAGSVAIAITLLARLLTVGLPVGMLKGVFQLPRGSWQVLTWGGLRGGISVALALSLPPGTERDLVLSLTYCVVLFSILVQGLTIGPLTRRAVGTTTP
jgi:CPA1 family monovalent cation:H+ antiporter